MSPICRKPPNRNSPPCAALLPRRRACNGDRASGASTSGSTASRRCGGSGGREETCCDRCEQLAERLQKMAVGMDFTFLYDRTRRLFAIGYNLATAQLDRSRYDLLASEARLASFLSIGKGEIDYRHWFHSGRPLTNTAGLTGLLSWGGTMFEYLMPSLFLRSYPETLLAQSCEAAVQRQMQFGRQQRHAVGRFGIGLRGSRCGADVPISIVRRSRLGAQARAGRKITSSPRMRRRWRWPCSRAKGCSIFVTSRPKAPRGRGDFTNRSTTRRAACRPARPRSSSAVILPIIRE